MSKPNTHIVHDMRKKYREVRTLVYQEATRPRNGCSAQHDANKAALKNKIVSICNESQLCNFTRSPIGYHRLWHHLWTKNRYAGIKASIASREISDIQEVFADFKQFVAPEWHVVKSGRRIDIDASGRMVRDFVQRTGPFQSKQTIPNSAKMRTIVNIARALAKFADDEPNKLPLEFVTGGASASDVWRIHEHLLKIGYRADLTALHLMMDLGFQVIKPDIVISRIFLHWGWLHSIIADLPSDLQAVDLQGGGKYRGRYLYTRPHMYKPVIDLACSIANGIPSSDLKADIGWVTQNPIREFDIFLVKSAQLREPGWGIERRIFSDISGSRPTLPGCRTNLVDTGVSLRGRD